MRPCEGVRDQLLAISPSTKADRSPLDAATSSGVAAMRARMVIICSKLTGLSAAKSNVPSKVGESGAAPEHAKRCCGNDAVLDFRGGYGVAVIVPGRILPIRKVAAVGAFHRRDCEAIARVNHPAAGSAGCPVDNRAAGSQARSRWSFCWRATHGT